MTKAADGENPFAKVFETTNSVHAGPCGTRYLELWCTADGRKGHLVMHFTGEKYVEQIAHLEKFNHHPMTNIQKYKVSVEIDGALPSDAQTSEYCEMIFYIDKFLDARMHAWLSNGCII